MPSSIVFSKSFLSFSKDKKVAEQFLKDKNKIENISKVLFILEKDDNIGYNLSTHGDIEKISFFPNEKEVLFFPFSSFEIKNLKEININNEKIYEIQLLYLGKYLKDIENDNNLIKNDILIPNTEFKKQIEEFGLIKIECNQTIKNIYSKYKKYETETLSQADLKLKSKSKYICKISVDGNKFGTGFFCKIPYLKRNIPVLITNYNIIDDNFMKNNNQLTIYINNDMKKISNLKNRRIYSSEQNKYDMMVIKLKEEDEIYNYLEIDQNIFKNNSENLFINEQVYLLHFPNSKEPSISYGKGIEKESDYSIRHFCNIKTGSSGAPILNYKTDKVIGIHKRIICLQNKQFNIGTYLKYPLNDLNKNMSLNKNEINGFFGIQEIFQSEDFHLLDLNEFDSKFRELAFFQELRKLKELHSDIIYGATKLTRKQLDYRGNRITGWSINEKRGNKPYYPPLGWIGIGLKVKSEYDGNNDSWIGNNNSPGEWCVAYHELPGGGDKSSDYIKHVLGIIIKSIFRPALSQPHKNCPDEYHPGNEVGKGVYFSPNPETVEPNTGVIEINGIKYKTLLMYRVKPDAIRHCSDSNFWVVNGTTDEIRPYRILYKKI